MGRGSGRWALAAALAIVVSTAHADIYRCTRNGEVSYQQTPCEAGSKNGRLQSDQAPSPLQGCYDVPSQPGFRITRRSDSEFILTGGHTAATRLRPATEEERKETGRANHLVIDDGMVMPDDTGDRPQGVYHGQNAEREEVFYIHLPFATGLVTKRANCSGATEP